MGRFGPEVILLRSHIHFRFPCFIFVFACFIAEGREKIRVRVMLSRKKFFDLSKEWQKFVTYSPEQSILIVNDLNLSYATVFCFQI